MLQRRLIYDLIKPKKYYSKLPPPQSPFSPIPQELIENLNQKIEAINKNVKRNAGF